MVKGNLLVLTCIRFICISPVSVIFSELLCKFGGYDIVHQAHPGNMKNWRRTIEMEMVFRNPSLQQQVKAHIIMPDHTLPQKPPLLYLLFIHFFLCQISRYKQILAHFHNHLTPAYQFTVFT